MNQVAEQLIVLIETPKTHACARACLRVCVPGWMWNHRPRRCASVVAQCWSVFICIFIILIRRIPVTNEQPHSAVDVARWQFNSFRPTARNFCRSPNAYGRPICLQTASTQAAVRDVISMSFTSAAPATRRWRHDLCGRSIFGISRRAVIAMGWRCSELRCVNAQLKLVETSRPIIAIKALCWLLAACGWKLDSTLVDTYWCKS